MEPERLRQIVTGRCVCAQVIDARLRPRHCSAAILTRGACGKGKWLRRIVLHTAVSALMTEAFIGAPVRIGSARWFRARSYRIACIGLIGSHPV